MKNIFRIVAVLLILGGLYGVTRTIMFATKHVFSHSQTKAEFKPYYDQQIKPAIDEKMAKLDLATLSPAERTNLQKVVTWIVANQDSNHYVASGYYVALFSLSISFFGILLGLIIILWMRQTNMRKRIDELAGSQLSLSVREKDTSNSKPTQESER